MALSLSIPFLISFSDDYKYTHLRSRKQLHLGRMQSTLVYFSLLVCLPRELGSKQRQHGEKMHLTHLNTL